MRHLAHKARQLNEAVKAHWARIKGPDPLPDAVRRVLRDKATWLRIQALVERMDAYENLTAEEKRRHALDLMKPILWDALHFTLWSEREILEQLAHVELRRQRLKHAGNWRRRGPWQTEQEG